MASYNFLNKVCIVTGASSGIGRATAVLLAKSKAHTVLVGRKMAALQETKAECKAAGSKDDEVLIVQADVSNDQERESIVKKAVAHFGKINVLVNNAGIMKNTSLESATFQVYDELMNINVRAPFFLTQLARPYLIQTRGSVVNVSSILSLVALPERIVYSMTKAAVNQFTRVAALELAPHGVRVNAVCPAFVATGIYLNSGFPDDVTAKMIERSKKIHPIGRAGNPEDIAHSIAFLASDASAFTTGATMMVDGGRTVVGAI